MNGAGSRNKGNRFERQVAEAFSKSFGEEIRRVPASGGLDIKCDLYNPFDDTFPYFIECKNRETFRIQSILEGTSDLYEFYIRNQDMANLSYLHTKYNSGYLVPIVVFKGGDFKLPMVLFKNLPDIPRKTEITFSHFRIVPMISFLNWCPKERLSVR